MSEIIDAVTGKDGALWVSLSRNIKQIKEGRALSILEDAELAYKRKIEDMSQTLKRLNRNVEASLDMSPENVTTLKMMDFDPEAFIETDAKAAYEIRNISIQLNECKKRYNILFGHVYDVEVL
jgi:hypothetical protein